MSKLVRLAERHHARSRRIKAAAIEVVRREWRKLDPDRIDESFYRSIYPAMVSAVELGQQAAASLAEDYVSEATGTRGEGIIDPRPFSGVAADGRPLESLMQQPLITAKTALKRNLSVPQALAYGESTAALITASETTDAGRTADGVAVAARPNTGGYIRLLTPPSCARCAVLAGRWYRWSAGFQRHPQCDCRHIPAAGADLVSSELTDPEAAVRGGQVHGLSKADREAIRDGADVSQVVNAKRGMYSAGGRKMTREGTTRRGFAFTRRGNKPRMRPEAIYQEAGSREEAISALRENGYIL